MARKKKERSLLQAAERVAAQQADEQAAAPILIPLLPPALPEEGIVQVPATDKTGAAVVVIVAEPRMTG
jgi:hypothetical protein